MFRLFVAFLLGLAFVSVCSGENERPPSYRPRIALALEGGGALGLAHVGVLKVIEEMGLPVDIVTGTSMGALIGGFYSIGYDARRIEAIVEGMDWSELFSEDTRYAGRTILSDMNDARYFAEIGFDKDGLKSRGGLLEGRNILEFFDRLTLGLPNDVDFDDFPRKYRAVATDLESGDAVAFSRGNLADAMRASMSFPAIFAPYFINGRYYVDGGVADNLPVGVAKGMGADVVIAVHIKGGNAYDPKNTGRSPVESVTRSLDQLTRANTKAELAQADFVITLDLEGYWITDFRKSDEILALGEKAARASEPELRNFLERLGKLDAPALPRIEDRPFTALLVEGAITERDRAEATKIYSGIVGLADYGPFLESAYRKLNAKSKYDYIRLRAESSAGGRTLVVSLAKKPDPGNSLRLGLAYSGYYTDAISNKFVVTPGIVFRNFPAEGMELQADATFFDTPGIQVDLILPFLEYLDLRASISAKSGYDTYYDVKAANYQYQTQAASGGIFLETGYLAHELLSLGWRADLLSTDDISAIYSCPVVKRASLLLLSSEYRLLDHPTLTTSGLSLKVDYALSLPALGSERYFQSILGKYGLYIPIREGNSLGFKYIAGTDFSQDSKGGVAAPLHYKPALSDRILFPAPLTTEETMGCFVAGGGIDLKFALLKTTGLLKIPIFAVLTAAVGTALQEIAADETEDRPFHANASLGLGVRFDDAFGVLLRGGVNRNSAGKLKPFFAADIGAIPL
jgi:NTE family protein